MRDRTEQEEKRRVFHSCMGLLTGGAMWAGVIAIGLSLFGCAATPARVVDYQRSAVWNLEQGEQLRRRYAEHCEPWKATVYWEGIRVNCEWVLARAERFAYYGARYQQIAAEQARYQTDQASSVLTAGGYALAGAAAGIRGDYSLPMASSVMGPNTYIRTPAGHVFGSDGSQYIRTPSGSYFGSDGTVFLNYGPPGF